MHGTHPSTDSKCEHDAGKKVPHVAPWHSLEHAPGGDGTGGEGGSGGIGEGGSSAAASQQPEQSHDHGGWETSAHGVVRKARQVPPAPPHGRPHAGGAGGGGARGGGEGGIVASSLKQEPPTCSSTSRYSASVYA